MVDAVLIRSWKSTEIPHHFRHLMTMRSVLLLAHLVLGFGVALAEEAKVPPKVTYDDHVKPILQQKCFSCHNPDKKSADLDLTTYTNLMLGGASGAVIEPGDASASYLFELVTHESEPVMPPESPKIADEMIETIRKWIDDGVLENSGSTAKASQKKKYDLGLAAPSTERPEVVPMPARMSLQPVLALATRTAVDALATSPWAPLAAVSGQHQVLLYRTDRLELVGVLPFPEGNPRVLKFSRNGGLLLAGGGVAGASGKVVVWDIRRGERIIEVGDELDEVLAADISSDQTLIALAGPQRVVRIYATDTGRLMHEIRKHTDWVTTLEFSPDSVLLATGDRNGGLFVWEAWTGRDYLTLNGHTASVNSVSWRSDSNILASASEDGTLRLWEMENGGQVKNWGAHGGGATSVEFTRDGRLFSCGRDRVAKLWDQNGGQQVAYEAFGDLALQATYCDETNRAIAGDWNGEIRVWNATDGQRQGELVMNPPTLEVRLAAATNQLTSIEQSHAPVAAAHQAAQTALQQLRASVDQTVKLAAEWKGKADAAATALAKSKMNAEQLTAERNAIGQQVDALVVAVPLLREAAEKASQAGAKLSSDPALVALARDLQGNAEAKANQLVSTKQALAMKTQAGETVAAEITALEQTQQQSLTELAAAQKKEQELVAQLPAVEQAAGAAQQSFDQSMQQLQAAQQAVARWNDEIAFSQRLQQLTAKRGELQSLLGEKETQHAELADAADAMAAKLAQSADLIKSTQATFEQLGRQHRESLDVLEKAKQAEQAAKQAMEDQMGTVRRLEQLSANVEEAAKKMEQAGALDPADRSLASTVESLRALASGKSKELETAKQEVSVKTQMHQQAIAQVQAMMQTVAQRLADVEKAKQQLAQHVAAGEQLEKEHAASQSTLQGAATELASVTEQLDAIQKTIDEAKGLTP